MRARSDWAALLNYTVSRQVYELEDILSIDDAVLVEIDLKWVGGHLMSVLI